jgi:hypothetical protein
MLAVRVLKEIELIEIEIEIEIEKEIEIEIEIGIEIEIWIGIEIGIDIEIEIEIEIEKEIGEELFRKHFSILVGAVSWSTFISRSLGGSDIKNKN